MPDIVSALAFPVLLIAVMYIMIFLPQRRRDKKTKEMLGAMQVGEKVITIGGITGKIINIKDDEITVETSIENTQIVFKRWAIKEVVKVAEL